jgi:DNA-binding Lrp family transcriptional regulator
MDNFPLDLHDRKLLSELDKNAAQSLAELARTLKRSKQFISYRMEKLETLRIITGYYAIVDMSKLGFFTFRVYLKLQQMSLMDRDELAEYTRKHFKQIWTVVSMHGKWDIALFIGVNAMTEFHTVWDGLLAEYKKRIKSYNIAIYAPIINFNRKFLLPTNEIGIERVYGAGTAEPIDQLDRDIIDIYAENVRQSAAEIGRKLNTSSNIVRTRIKSLEQRKVIVGYKVDFDLGKLNLAGYRVDLQLISTDRNKELLQFCSMHKNIYQVNKSIGGADFEIEVVVKDLPHLLQVIDEIRTRFKDVINDAEWLGFTTIHTLKYIPD